jgi:hypothetical protein
METSRRSFIQFAAPLLVLSGAAVRLAAAPFQDQQLPTPPGVPHMDLPTLNPEEVMKMDQKDLKKDVEKLFTLAQELKTQAEKTDTSNVLPLGFVHKAEEIEKLARHIAKLAKEG